MQYTEYAPSAWLAPYVRCLWTLEGNAADLNEPIQPVLPDGCPELVVHLADRFERLHTDGRIERQPVLLFAGQLTEQLSLRPTGRVAVVAARFHPDGAAALLDVPQSELVGLTIGLESVSRQLSPSLRSVGEKASSLREAARLLERSLAERVDPSRTDACVRYAVDAIQRRSGSVSIDRLAQRVGWTRRHLERRFQAVVGISPKRLARIARFQSALRVLEGLDAPNRSTRTALALGYADQAHFVREFRELAGCAPGAHLIRSAELNGYFSSQASLKNPEKATSPAAVSTE